MLWPGLGHAYAGAPIRGFAMMAALYLGVIPLLSLLAAEATLPALAAFLGAAVAIVTAIAVDAARIAARPRMRFLARGSVLLVCLGFIAASLPLQLAWEWIKRDLPMAYYAPSAAMEPTILIGDHLFADPRGYEPARGDVVVVRMARDGDRRIVPCHENPDLACEAFIKRIVGLPGDTVRFDGAALYVNEELRTGDPSFEKSTDWRGVTLSIRPESLGSRQYRIADAVDRSAPKSATVIVEPERYFVSGDNRDNSNDSRYWGTVFRADIIGRATKIYWSWDNEESWLRMLNPLVVWKLLRDKTRWDRIGQSIE
jgi:signal peptidase I